MSLFSTRMGISRLIKLTEISALIKLQDQKIDIGIRDMSNSRLLSNQSSRIQIAQCAICTEEPDWMEGRPILF